MLSYIFLAYAVIHLAIWLWGWKLWSTTGRPVALLLVLVSSTLLSYDNFRIGIGRFLGQGDFLYSLSVPAFAWHWALLPLLVIAVGSIARLAGLRWAGNRIVMGAFCIVAVALSVHDIPRIFSMELHPTCFADILRYSTSVREGQVCTGGVVVPGSTDTAIAAIITNVITLFVGIAVWARRRWPWMAAGSALMFFAAGAFARSPYSMVIANLGEICFTLGLIATCVHFARKRQQRATAA